MPRHNRVSDDEQETVPVSHDEVGSMEDLHAITTRELMAAHAVETLVYTGSYITQVRAVYEKQNADDAEFDAGRLVKNLAVTYLDRDDPTKKVGTGFIKTSPEPRFTATGKLDNASKRYAELAKALSLNGFDPDEVYEQAMKQMIMVKVRESYIVPESDLHPTHADARVNTSGDAWVTLDKEDEEEREYYLDMGLEPRVMVDRVYKVKGGSTPTTSRRSAHVADDDVPF